MKVDTTENFDDDFFGCFVLIYIYKAKRGDVDLVKKKNETTLRSNAVEYLTYVASIGNQQESIEMCYEDENIWLTQKCWPLYTM